VLPYIHQWVERRCRISRLQLVGPNAYRKSRRAVETPMGNRTEPTHKGRADSLQPGGLQSLADCFRRCRRLSTSTTRRDYLIAKSRRHRHTTGSLSTDVWPIRYSLIRLPSHQWRRLLELSARAGLRPHTQAEHLRKKKDKSCWKTKTATTGQGRVRRARTS